MLVGLRCWKGTDDALDSDYAAGGVLGSCKDSRSSCKNPDDDEIRSHEVPRTTIGRVYTIKPFIAGYARDVVSAAEIALHMRQQESSCRPYVASSF